MPWPGDKHTLKIPVKRLKTQHLRFRSSTYDFSSLSLAIVRTWSKILFMISALLFVAFLFFITDRGQEILRGPLPKNATGFQLDDIDMGAGLAPWAWMLVPSIFLAIIALAMKRSAKRIEGAKN
jgi:hypothetical protein